LFERIRRAQRDEGLSGRELSARFKVSRRTVRQAIDSPLPPKRKSPPPRASVLEPVKCFIDAMLREEVAGARVISLHTRRLPPDPRPSLPDMSKYDRLLNPAGTRRTSTISKGHGA
jgi:transposase